MPPLIPRLAARDEFPAGTSEWPSDVSRREFLQLMAASFALAGVTACTRRPAKLIVPSVIPPESMSMPGQVSSFATTRPSEGYGRGILVRTNSGRPTKIEGNPDHPESRGATDVFTQAAILSLYDPNRSHAPVHQGAPATWSGFESAWSARRDELTTRNGAGLAILTEPTTSPTMLREIFQFLEKFPAARWYQHAPLGSHGCDGRLNDFDFTHADVILAIESDCFYRHPAALRYGRALASRRRSENGKVSLPSFYAFEAVPSVSGALADYRLPASPGRLRLALNHLAAAIDREVLPAKEFSVAENNVIHALARDIRTHRGRVACVVGPECDEEIKAWAAALNARDGGDAVKSIPDPRSDRDPRASGDLAALTNAISRDEIQSLFVLGCNPVYTSAPELNVAEKIRRVAFTVHVGETVDETAAASQWHLPETHFLEAWGDWRTWDGTASIQQPVIEPMHDARSLVEVLRMINTGLGTAGYEIVRETWRGSGTPDQFESRWHESLSRGVIRDTEEHSSRATSLASVEFPVLAPVASSAMTVIIQPDPNILDGRWTANAWLQELPKPLTHLVWENAGLISPQTATSHQLENGDVVVCEVGGTSLDIPVWIMPGQADDTLAVALGYGRTHAGPIGSGLGYDAFRFRTIQSPWHRDGAVLRKLNRQHPLVCTQGHFAMEGREPARVIAPSVVGDRIEGPQPQTSLFADWRKDTYAWGMSIDLSTCLGCNACVIACQAENNIPVVGRDQVSRQREMHWIRIDRYYSGNIANPRFIAQPVPCMHCENAPCEVVCPVGATVHSSEGLNDMIYNRCVGTRYCSNNCPYKVRRFNFLDYRMPRDSTAYLQANPNVTVRERGVMEKCTYCVQRINAARITAEKENRKIRDGDIRTACQQACPAEAIVFGDLNDPASRVSQRKSEPANYSLLSELNTRPRTTYLAAVRQPVLPT